MEGETKRLFFGMEVAAPWPEELPQGRILDPNHRHLTLAFLGNTDANKLLEALKSLPPLPIKVGVVGKFDQSLFLPKRHPRVAAWHIAWFDSEPKVIALHDQLNKWLRAQGFAFNTRHTFDPHVTLARSPFNLRVWQKKFSPIPLILKDIHLYESVGKLVYQPIWSHSLLSPFTELDHTADIAFVVRGESYTQLLHNAQGALAFYFPPILSYLDGEQAPQDLEEVIVLLNRVIAKADGEIGVPFKAVSFHSELTREEDVLFWEMIIDV